MRVSRCMSTQHPDNVSQPFFSSSPVLGGDDEIKEAFYSYSHLGCNEQLWDCEGKEVDTHVVKKLLTGYEPFFSKKRLGKDVFLTLRVPNPEYEKSEAKILVETLESIPRSFDVANAFYNESSPPIFEVALPMVSGAKEVVMLSKFYRDFVAGKADKTIAGTRVSEWLGSFSPKHIRVIPLIETKEAILDSAKIVEGLVRQEKPDDYQRVWLARSDPALNYGCTACVITLKVALQRLSALDLGVEVLPILGCGSAPFRGNLTPKNTKGVLEGYPTVQTFTLQSAFKYDNPSDEVRSAIQLINSTPRKTKPIYVEEGRALTLIDKLSAEYNKQISLISGIVNQMANHIPPKRRRKLHIGLFGYARKSAKVHLPRAITFCAALYSYGFPPELLALNALTERDIDFITGFYPNFESDTADALQYLNKDNLKLFPRELVRRLTPALKRFSFSQNMKHKKVTDIIADDFRKQRYSVLQENIGRAAWIRGFLG